MYHHDKQDHDICKYDFKMTVRDQRVYGEGGRGKDLKKAVHVDQYIVAKINVKIDR